MLFSFRGCGFARGGLLVAAAKPCLFLTKAKLRRRDGVQVNARAGSSDCQGRLHLGALCAVLGCGPDLGPHLYF